MRLEGRGSALCAQRLLGNMREIEVALEMVPAAAKQPALVC